MAEVSVNAKTCRKCGELFYGRGCLACSRRRFASYYSENADKVNARIEAYRKAHPENRKAQRTAWIKANPEKVAASREKHKEQSAATTAAWQSRNRKRVLANVAAYYVANREKCKTAIEAWHKANPDARRIHWENRRARECGGKLSTGLVERLFTLQRGKCPCCRSDLRKTSFHLDHTMPLAKGGTNDDVNMQLLCPPCNLEKHAKHPVEFMQSRGFLL
jgi:predicted  nucleic acid-binding Zn-ribbon protein